MTMGVRRGQSISGFITEFPGERCSGPGTELLGSGLSTPRARTGSLQFFLDPFPNRLAYDRLMLSIPDFGLVADLSDVDRVAQSRIDLAARECITALDPPGLETVQLGAQAQLIGATHDSIQAAEVLVEGEDRPHCFSFVCVDDEAADLGIGMRIVSERRHAAHPKTLLLGGRDLVPDPLGRHLTLKLGKGQQNVERQPAHRRGGVEGLGNRDKGTTGGIEALDQLGKVGKGSGQTINLVDYNHLNEPRVDVCQQALKAGPVERATGDAAIVISGLARNPAFVPLAGDVCGTRLVLGIERIEVLVVPLVGGFTRVDGASDSRLAHGQPARFRPKKRGPDHRAPVMARAIGDSDA